jgi:hypothetical protein
MACLVDQWEDPERDDDSFRATVAVLDKNSIRHCSHGLGRFRPHVGSHDGAR